MASQIDILQRNKTELERTLADAMGYKAQVSELENASVALKAEVDKLQALLTVSEVPFFSRYILAVTNVLLVIDTLPFPGVQLSRPQAKMLSS